MTTFRARNFATWPDSSQQLLRVCAEPATRGRRARPAAPMAKKKYEEEVEFGGPIGCAFIMLASHCLGVAMAVAVFGLDDLSVFTPTPYAFGLLVSFHALQMVLARVMPGVVIRGLSELDYNCNAYTSMFATLAVYIALHRMEARTAPRALACRARRAALGAAPCPRRLPCLGPPRRTLVPIVASTWHVRSTAFVHVALSGAPTCDSSASSTWQILDLVTFIELYPALQTASVILGDIYSLLFYVGTIAIGKQERRSCCCVTAVEVYS